MSALSEAIETAEKKEFTQDEVLDWLESVYNFCIPENKEAGEHAFNVLDYYYMEELGAHIKRQYSELATLRAQLAEAKDIVIVLAWLDELLQPDESKEFVSVNILTSTIKKARAWYEKVNSA